MLNILREPSDPRKRDPVAERRERRRYDVLRAVHEGTRHSPEAALPGRELGDALGLAPEETFRIIQFLAQHGYLHYMGAGPRVSITPKGVQYVERDAGRRRSVRG